MLEFRELHPDDVCTALSLGDAGFTPLKTFLRKEAKRLHKDNLDTSPHSALKFRFKFFPPLLRPRNNFLVFLPFWGQPLCKNRRAPV